MNKMEAITISIGATALKFLKITLPQNIKFFDNYIVATDSKDTATQEYCKQWPVTLVISDSFYDGGAYFNKGKVYTEIFKILQFCQWITILDADIIISDRLGKYLKEFDFDKECFYSPRRVIVPKYYDYNMLCNWGKEYEDKLTTCPGVGWGYFQQVHYDSLIFKKEWNHSYPESFLKYAAVSDWVFRNKWGEPINDYKDCSGLLREIPIRCWHLSEPCMDLGEKFFLAN